MIVNIKMTKLQLQITQAALQQVQISGTRAQVTDLLAEIERLEAVLRNALPEEPPVPANGEV